MEMLSIVKALVEVVRVCGGYLGVFAISLVSNSIPFVGVPYLLIVAHYIARESIRLGLPAEVALVAASALGSTVGKIVVYATAASFRAKLGERTKENLRYFVNYTKKVSFLLIVLFAATPAPDDMMYVPLGVARYPLHLFFFGVFVGKLLMVWLVSMYFRLIYAYLGEELVYNPVAALCVAAVTIYLTVAIMKMNWRSVAETYSEKGPLASAKMVLKEFASVNVEAVKKVLRCGGRQGEDSSTGLSRS